MAYKRLNLTDGMVMTASHVKHLEDGIANAAPAEVVAAIIDDTAVSEDTTWSSEKINNAVGQLSEEIGVARKVAVSAIAEWQSGRITAIDTSGNLTVHAQENMSYIRIDDVSRFASLDTTTVYPAFDGHPACWLVTICDTDGNRTHAATEAVIKYGDQDTARGDWYTSDESGMHIDIPALLTAIPDAGVIYLCKWNAEGFDWTYTTESNGLTQKVSELETRVEGMESAIEGVTHAPEVLLPARVIAVAGHEFNLYFDNVIVGDHATLYVTASIAPSGITYRNLGDCLRFTPTDDNSGEYTITINLLDMLTREVVSSATCTLMVIADAELSGKTVLFIGDSLTDAGIYPAEIQHNLSNGGIVSLGTRSDTVSIGGQSLTVNHEGRSGWASYDYTRTGGSYREDVENAFWDGTAFNFGWYMQQQGYSGVDIVCINLGTNGVGNTDNRTVDAIDLMIASIHAYDPDIMVLVSLIAPPASQEGWGMRVAGSGTAGQFRMQEVALIKEYKARYEGLDTVDVTELYIGLDCVHDYPTKTEAVSARNPTEVVRQNNNVHPSEYGYLKFADVYYNNILYHLTK